MGQMMTTMSAVPKKQSFVFNILLGTNAQRLILCEILFAGFPLWSASIIWNCYGSWGPFLLSLYCQNCMYNLPLVEVPKCTHSHSSSGAGIACITNHLSQTLDLSLSQRPATHAILHSYLCLSNVWSTTRASGSTSKFIQSSLFPIVGCGTQLPSAPSSFSYLGLFPTPAGCQSCAVCTSQCKALTVIWRCRYPRGDGPRTYLDVCPVDGGRSAYSGKTRPEFAQSSLNLTDTMTSFGISKMKALLQFLRCSRKTTWLHNVDNNMGHFFIPQTILSSAHSHFFCQTH